MAANKIETSRRTLPMMLVMLLIGALAGGAGVFLAETYSKHFEIPAELQKLSGNLSSEQTQQIRAAFVKAEFQNTTLVMGLFGAALGGLLGLGIGWIERSGAKSLLGLLLGGLLGGIGGAGAGYAGRWIWGWLETSTQWDITLRTCVTHAAVWAILGVAIGLAAGLLVAPRLKSVFKAVGALIGAGILAGMIYPISAAAIFPNANPDQTIPDGLENRILWAMLASVLFSLILGRTLNRKPAQPAPGKTA